MCIRTTAGKGDTMVPLITREELKGRIDRRERFVLVEALPEFMYSQGHLPGAINIPPPRVTELARKLIPDRSAEIIVYCANDT